MSFDDFDDLDVDFDAADVEGKLAAVIQTVEFRRKLNEAEGVISEGANVTFIIEDDATFEGQWVNSYYWLGSRDKDTGEVVKRPNATNVKAFKIFVEAATGVRPEGKIRLSEYQPEKRQVGKNEVTCLTALEGGHVLITVKVETGKDNVERSVVKAVTQYSGGPITDDEDEPI